MAVVARGGSRSPAKPRTKAVAASSGRKGPAKAGRYVPAKLAAARGVGLTPLSAVTIAAGVFVIALGATLFVDPRLHRLAANLSVGADHELASLGLTVKTLTVQGATPMAQADILRAAAIPQGEPILHVDLPALRQRIEAVGWVKQAKVVRFLPDTIVIGIVQRQTLAVWQHQGKTQVVDVEGRVIPEADPGQFTNLPLVVGDGAAEAAPAILPVVKSRPQLMDNLEALVRVDDRRWDVRLKDGGLIQLPASGEEQALATLDQLDQKSRILELGFARIDLRDPELVAVRPKDAPAPGQLVANGA
jgi:cell division protein FtsQ